MRARPATPGRAEPASPAALDEREARQQRSPCVQQQRQRAEDASVGIGEVALHDSRESDEGSDDENRRRPSPEDPAQPESAHDFAAAFLSCLRVFCAMNCSTNSRDSSSRICFGGDFIR